jgi:hypothetical protein
VTQTAVSQIVGIDASGERIVCATVETGQGRPQVLSIVEQAPVDPAVSAGKSLTISVPDDECVIKNLRLRGADREDIELRAKFELSQSMLEAPEIFRFEVVASLRENRHIGVAYRRTLLMERAEALGIAADSIQSISFLPRSAALGKAYRAFCRPKGGELVCLADFAGSFVSICILYRNEIAGLASLPESFAAAMEVSAVRRLAVNFKTVANFKLLSLAEDGITIPLSALIISGVGADDRLKKALEEFFPAGVDYPEFSASQFVLPELVENGMAARSVVALGLAVN